MMKHSDRRQSGASNLCRLGLITVQCAGFIRACAQVGELL